MSWFDDEGTILVGFRSLLDGHRMYDEIYSLYGPLYNAVYGLIYAVLRVPLTHTSGRCIAAVLWLAYTAGFAAIGRCLTRSPAVLVFVYMLVLFWLLPLRNSPGHPEELCLLLLAAILLLGYRVEVSRDTGTLVALGAAVAGLALIKINIGAYVGLGLAFVLARFTAPSTWTRVAIPVVTVSLPLLPFTVEALLFNFWWVRVYCLFAALTISAALVASTRPSKYVLAGVIDWWIVAIGGVATCVAVICGMMLAGSSIHAIINAVLLQNAHFILNWYLPLDICWRGLAAAAASVLTALAWRLSGVYPGLERWRAWMIVALKCGFVATGIILFTSASDAFRMLAPFCWLVMVPPEESLRPNAAARSLLGVIGALMSLYPFPVAGHQINIGGLLPIVMIPILAHDALRALPQSARNRFPGAWSLAAPLAVGLALFLGAAMTYASALSYFDDVPLGLPGTALIRVDRKQADDFRWITDRLASCQSSYSLPGMFSFTFWTGHALASSMNINDVLAFIDPEQQRTIVAALSREPDLCVVYNPSYLRFFDRGQIRDDPPLLHFIQTEFTEDGRRDGFLILKRRDPPG